MLYLIRHQDGRHVAERLSAVFDGILYRWTAIRGRACRFSDRARAVSLATDLIAEDPECHAVVISEEEARERMTPAEREADRAFLEGRR